MGACLLVGECVHVHAVPTEARGGARCSGAGIVGSCEPPVLDAGNKTTVPAKPSPFCLYFIRQLLFSCHYYSLPWKLSYTQSKEMSQGSSTDTVQNCVTHASSRLGPTQITIQYVPEKGSARVGFYV